MRLLGYAVVGLCGCWVMRLLGYAVIGLCGFTVVWVCGDEVSYGLTVVRLAAFLAVETNNGTTG